MRLKDFCSKTKFFKNKISFPKINFFFKIKFFFLLKLKTSASVQYYLTPEEFWESFGLSGGVLFPAEEAEGRIPFILLQNNLQS